MSTTIPTERCTYSMTNFDHTIEVGMAEYLQLHPDQYGEHLAWNFYGRVWYDSGQFHEQVLCYGAPRAVLSAPTLEELMRVVNDAFGSE